MTVTRPSGPGGSDIVPDNAAARRAALFAIVRARIFGSKTPGSAERGICTPADAERVSDHLEAMGLTTTLGPIPATGDALVAHMCHDKKASGGRLPFILVRGIGERPARIADGVLCAIDAVP